MKTRKGVNTGGGTPVGVRKPHRRMTKETSGVVMRGYGDAFSDVGRACSLFLRSRMEMGVMTEKEAMPGFPRKIQISNFKTQ